MLESIHECDEHKEFICNLPPEPAEHSSIIALLDHYRDMGKRFDYLRVRFRINVYRLNYHLGSCFGCGLYQSGPKPYGFARQCVPSVCILKSIASRFCFNAKYKINNLRYFPCNPKNGGGSGQNCSQFIQWTKRSCWNCTSQSVLLFKIHLHLIDDYGWHRINHFGLFVKPEFGSF